MKYYKGLGSSTNEEAQISFKDFKQNMFSYKLANEDDDVILKKAFETEEADHRKTMIQNFNGEYLDYKNVKEVTC